ncbi:MAG: pyruvate dehydrogenase, partial [Planctomycetes bacterium]|nr:pyruvate dehydrogenase [Planctomycetota bacterium]
MEKEVKLPELGSGIKSADVVEVLVRVGDVVEQDQGLLEIETDKATATVPSPLSGRVSRIVVERGQTLAIDALLMMIDAKEAAPVVAPARAASLASVAAAIAPQATPVASSPPATPAAGSSAAPERREPEPAESASVAAGPAIRKFAREVGIDLRTVRGSGEHGRITRDDVLNAVRQASRLASSRGKTDSGAGTNPTETLLTDDWGQI